MKQSHIAIGIDPAFREYGMTISIKNTVKKIVVFYRFKRFIDWFDFIVKTADQLKEQSTEYCVGIENSYLVKKIFDIEGLDEKKKIGRIQAASMNRATSAIVVELCKRFFDPERVFEFKPLSSGSSATGGKKTHAYFEATCRTMNLTTVNYPDVDRKNWKKITTTADQDCRDAFYIGEFAAQEQRFKKRVRPIRPARKRK